MSPDTYIQRLNEWFLAEPRSVPVARHVAESVRGVLGYRVCARISLLASELVTNAVIYGGRYPTDTLRLRIWTSPESVRVAVYDRGSGFDETPAVSSQELSPAGWGLYLVRRMADRWGVRRDPGTEVWFEIDRSDEPVGVSPTAGSTVEAADCRISSAGPDRPPVMASFTA